MDIRNMLDDDAGELRIILKRYPIVKDGAIVGETLYVLPLNHLCAYFVFGVIVTVGTWAADIIGRIPFNGMFVLGWWAATIFTLLYRINLTLKDQL